MCTQSRDCRKSGETETFQPILVNKTICCLVPHLLDKLKASKYGIFRQSQGNIGIELYYDAPDRAKCRPGYTDDGRGLHDAKSKNQKKKTVHNPMQIPEKIEH